MTVSEYIKELQTYEEYSFSWNEIVENCDKTEVLLKKELTRLVNKKEILNLRKGFYLIIPLRYSKQGQIPIQLYIDKLFKSLNRAYYIGFYSAAKFHGASHQQIQKEYIMIESPSLSNIKKSAIDIKFITSSKWAKNNIIKQKSDAGLFNVSSPALTIADLIHHQSKLGGLNRMLAIIEELTEELSESDLNDLLEWYPYVSTLQRMGFLLEVVQAGNHFEQILLKYLSKRKFYPVLLSNKLGEKAGAANNQWKIDVNIQLESDL